MFIHTGELHPLAAGGGAGGRKKREDSLRGGRAHFATKGEVRSQERASHGGAPKRWEAINGDRRNKKKEEKGARLRKK